MQYEIDETITEIRYVARITFAESILDFFNDDADFSIVITDLIDGNELVIDTFEKFNNYTFTAPFYDSIQLENDSLINNGGLVLYLDGDNVLRLILAPKCSFGGQTIGFNTAKIAITCGEAHGDTTQIKLIASLYPRIVRDSDIIKANPDASDPILPDNVSRSCYEYPNVTTDDIVKVKTLFNYDTKGSIYVNTTAEESQGDTAMVPLYINRLGVYFTNESISAISNMEIESYIKNMNTGKTYDISYDMATEPTVKIFNTLSAAHADSPDLEYGDWYTTETSAYSATQKIYFNGYNGRYKDSLYFGIKFTSADNFNEIDEDDSIIDSFESEYTDFINNYLNY